MISGAFIGAMLLIGLYLTIGAARTRDWVSGLSGVAIIAFATWAIIAA